MASLKRQFAQLQQTVKDQKEVTRKLKNHVKDLKTDYDNKFTVNYNHVTNLEERIQELEDYNQREDSGPTVQTVPASSSRSSGK